MTINRFKTPAGGGIFGGEEVNRQVIKFEKASIIQFYCVP
jgi:hypothetical protein